MPTFQITGPDGKSYRVSGDSAEGALQALQKHIGAKPDAGNLKMDASTVYVDEMLFGLPGKAAAGMNALAQRGIAALPGESPWEGQGVGQLYDTNRSQYQNAREQYAEENPVANAAASIGGAIHGGSSLTRAAGSVMGRVAPRVAQLAQRSYGARMGADAAAGAGMGALSAYGHDQDIGTGALIGGVAGGLARPVVDAGAAVARSVGGLAGIGNQARASSALTELLERSGKSVDDIADDLARAAQDGQPEYMVADSLGNSGQRMLAGVARSPGDMRQTIAETLQRRQVGQGERLVNALAEGFDAPTTANQARTSLTAARTSAANANYGAARQSAGAVDPTKAIAAADEFLGSAGSIPRTNIADDSIEGAVRRARAMLTDGDSVVSEFDTAFRAKQELDAMIERAAPTVQRQLIPIRNALDDALATSSQPYATARDQFRQQSQAIEAVDQGIGATSARARASDNIAQFQGMRPDQQQAFRQGYADPLIARIEAASMSPSTNKARMLLTEKSGQEFPAFAAPGRADIMGNRIVREQRMFETAAQALGGSRTADNLSDIADVQSFDPTMIGALLTGNFRGAALQGLQKGINTLQGRNSQTRDLIAKALLQSSPTRANAELARAVATGQRLTKAQETIVRALIAGGATAAPRAQTQ